MKGCSFLSDKTKNVFPESFRVIGNFAISVAASYFVTIIAIEDWFNVSVSVYIALLIITVILLAYQVFRTIRYFILRHRDSKQTTYTSYFGLMGKRRTDVDVPFTYSGLNWQVTFNVPQRKVEDVSYPFCPKEDCETALNTKMTYWGKYLYDCPNCSFKEKKDLRVSTLRNNLEKIAEAQMKREIREALENENA